MTDPPFPPVGDGVVFHDRNGIDLGDAGKPSLRDYWVYLEHNNKGKPAANNGKKSTAFR